MILINIFNVTTVMLEPSLMSCVDKYCLHWQGDLRPVCSRGGNIESNISLGCKSPAVNTGESVERSRSGERRGATKLYFILTIHYEVLQHVDRYQCWYQCWYRASSLSALGCNHQCRLPAPVSTFYQPVHLMSLILTLILSKSHQQCSFIVE